MQNLREAAQQALEALEIANNSVTPQQFFDEEIAALRAALAEDRSVESGKTSDHIADANKMVATSQEFRQVEPVAYMMVNKTHKHAPCLHFTPPEDWHATWEAVPLYLDPPKRKPLTAEKIEAVADSLPIDDMSMPTTWHLRLARAIERAHGIGGEE